MQDRTYNAARYGWGGPALLATLLLAVSMTGLPRAAADGKTAGPDKSKNQNSQSDWQTLDREKDGTIQICYRLPDAFSRVWTWRFRSTFNRPVHVDYRIGVLGRSGFPIEVDRTAFIPAKGSTERLGFPSNLQPSISVEQVR